MASKTNGTTEDRVVKMEVDYTSTIDEKLAEAKKTASEGNLYEALESLLSLEKQTRTNVDLTSTSRVLVTIVQICHDAKNWNALNEHIVLLSKRRSQIKEAVTKMVQECCTYVDTAPSKEIKMKLIDTLRTVTEGKIYVEVERARLTHILAKMKEDDGDIQGAADTIQELQVETYGSMEKKEKVELILEQMRLCLAKRDYIRTQIISKKISTKFFEDESTSELKLKYYRYYFIMAPSKMFASAFMEYWLIDPEFEGWLKSAESPNKFWCSWCRKICSLSNMGKTALRSHADSACHQAIKDAREKLGYVFLPRQVQPSTPTTSNSSSGSSQPIPVVVSQSVPVNEASVSATSQNLAKKKFQQKQIQTLITKNSITDAEIIWCLATVFHHISQSAGGSCTTYFPTMFNCEEAKKMKLGRTKIGYVVVYGLAKYIREEILSELEESPFFSVSFDESLNKVAQKEQMDLSVRYWSTSKNEVVTRYIGSVFLAGSTALDLLEGFNSEVSSFLKKNEEKSKTDKNKKKSKMVHVSTDGPNVMKKFHKDLQADLMSKDETLSKDFELINIGSCGLHTINNSFKSGMKETKWDISGFLRSSFDVLKNCPARRADYIRLGGTTNFPLKFCGVRWLENLPVAERALSISSNLIKYATDIQGSRREPTSKSFIKMKNYLNDPLLKVKLAFFIDIAGRMQPFLKAYQGEKPLVPFMYDDVTKLLDSLMSSIVKEEILNEKNPHSIDINKVENLLPATQIVLCNGVKHEIRKNRSAISDKDILQFKKDCLACLKKIISMILEKSPLKYPLTKYLSFCNPLFITKCLRKKNTDHEARLKQCVEKLVDTDQIGSAFGDKVERSFSELCRDDTAKSRLSCFKRKDDRLDHFWRDLVRDCEAGDELMTFLKLVFVLFHGNAHVEGGFSVNKEVLIENQIHRSLVGQRLVYGGVQAAGGVLNVKITNRMRELVRTSHNEYTTFLEEQKAVQEKLNTERYQLKRKAAERKELEDEIKRLNEDVRIKTRKLNEQISKL